MTLALSLMAFAQAVATRPTPSTAPLLEARVKPQQCVGSSSDEVVICGQPQRSYRIDPNVLQAERAATAVPDAVQVRDPNQYAQCVGPHCGGDFIPLVPIAMRLVAAGIDAAKGNDWRQDFRTHPDEYGAYEEAKAKQRSVSVGVSVSAGTAR